MVAITVILAAVIGTFVLGLGDQVQNTTPQAQFGFTQTTETITDNNGSSAEFTKVTISHESGDSISESDLSVTVNGEAYGGTTTGNDEVTQLWSGSGDVSAGSSVTLYSSSSYSADFSSNSYLYEVDGSTLDLHENSLSNEVDTGIGLSSGDTVRVIYDSPDSDKSATLAKHEIQ